MDKVKVLIVEDEVVIAESLREILENLGYEVTGVAMRAKDALNLIEEEMPDLAMLDINLKGEEDGIWLADQIHEKYSFPYVFLTSYGNQSTVERAVKTKPYGYLMKPFEKVDIYTAIEVALHNYANHQNINTPEEKPDSVVIRDSIFIKDEYLFVKITFANIIYIKADGNYLEIHTDTKRHVIKTPMKDLSAKLPTDIFVQTHRSYIVNLNRIDSFGANYININKVELPISATYKEDLVKKLMLH